MKYIIWPLLVLLVFVRYFTTRPVYKNGDRIRISGAVYSDPTRYPTSQYIKLAGLKFYLPLTPEISYGDNIAVEGFVQNGKLQKAKLIRIEDERNLTANFRNSIISFYEKVLPQPMSGLLGGIVLGSKGALTPDFYDMTKVTGVAHVVVASGTNVTFVVSFLMAASALFLPRKKSIPFVILGVVLYLFISGFDAPLVRAAIMSGLAFGVQELGRTVSAWRILILAALLMLVYNPEWALDIGFLLSFASTASIMAFQRKLAHVLRFLPKIIKEDAVTTISAQIGVAPILFVTFGRFNILSPIINALVLWTVPPLMVVGAFGGALGLVFPLLGKLILWLGYPMLWWFSKAVLSFG